MNKLIQDASKREFGCFVAGTEVLVEGGRVKPIEEIMIGDRVYSKPENGSGELALKRVINTNIHENKEVWFVSYRQMNDDFDFHTSQSIVEFHVGVTSNHPFWVTGICEDSGASVGGAPEGYEPYAQGEWKRVDQLLDNEVITNTRGKTYCITNARPLSAHSMGKDYAWLQGTADFSPYDWQTREAGVLYNITERQKHDIGDFELVLQDFNTIAEEIENSEMMLGDTPEAGYRPYRTNVYNIEVEDNHTYFINAQGIWVHNTNCGEDQITA